MQRRCIPAWIGPGDDATAALSGSHISSVAHREGPGKGSKLTKITSISAIKAAADIFGRYFGSETKEQPTGFWRAQTRLPTIRQSACQGRKSIGRHPRWGLGERTKHPPDHRAHRFGLARRRGAKHQCLRLVIRHGFGHRHLGPVLGH